MKTLYEEYQDLLLYEKKHAGVILEVVHDDKVRLIHYQDAYDLIKLALIVLNNAAMCQAIQGIQEKSNDH